MDRASDIFEALGFHLSQVARRFAVEGLSACASPGCSRPSPAGRRARFWPGSFEATLARALVVAFFLALVLALAESVSIQSMTLTLQALHTTKPTLRWLCDRGLARIARRAADRPRLRESASRRSCCSGGSTLPSAVVLGVSIAGSVVIANLAGISVPASLHALRLDPKIAAGPITLAPADILTLLLYFSLASWLL